MFTTVNRDNTQSIKWERYRKQNLLPMWVADMDIASPVAIKEALITRAQHGVYGYTHPWASLNQSVVNWCEQQYGWKIDADWIIWMPGVVPSFNLACDAFGKGGRIIVQTPNYPPMLAAAERQGCTTVPLPITWTNESWQWDWQTLEQELAHPDCHLFLMCNPMNPHGTVLIKEDLTKLADLCQQTNVMLCSDEIHCDLILDGTKHTPAGSVTGLQDNSITLMAASKTFNVAGLGCSFALIPNADVRSTFVNRMTDLVPQPSFMGLIAAETAFSECSNWHQDLLVHLKSNRDLLNSALSDLKGIKYRPQSATFLAWIESDKANLSLDRHFIAAGIMPSEGKFFGSAESVRINFGTGRETLQQGIDMLTNYWRQNTP